MAQPQGMRNAKYPHQVCRLHKAIYGLKQAPRAWYQELRTFLLSLGFVTSRADSSLFVYSRGTALIYFLVYVDDLIITGNGPSLGDTIIWQLDSTFSIKDLRPLSYFYGVEVLATSSSLLLSQQKYVIDLLRKHNMLDSKPVSTPLVMGTSLTSNDGTTPINATMYRQVMVASTMHAQSEHHWGEVKHLLRYLNGM